MPTNQFIKNISVVLSVIMISLVLNNYLKPSMRKDTEVLGISEESSNIPSTYINLGRPYEFTILPDGNIWYADILHRLVKISPTGEVLRTIGREGTGEGEFASLVTSVTHDNDGNIYVQDYSKTSKFDSNGGFIKSWVRIIDGQEIPYQNPQSIHFDNFSNTLLVSETPQDKVIRYDLEGNLLNQFGTSGSSDGQLDDPWGISTDSSGNIYIVDHASHRVQVFTENGTYIRKFGVQGTGDGQLNFPTGVTVASNGDVFVASEQSSKVQVFNSNGDWIQTIGEFGTSAWQLVAPHGVKLDPSGNVWVSDVGLRSFQKYSQTGQYISGIRNSGNVSGKLFLPTSVAYDLVGNLYVLDNGPRIQKFTNAGTYLTNIVSAPSALDGNARHLYFDQNNKLYASTSTGVVVYDTSGNILLQFGSSGSGDGQFLDARGIGVDSDNNIYVADAGNSRIQKFDNAGVYITQWGTRGVEHGQLAAPDALVIDSNDEVYVADTWYDPYYIGGATGDIIRPHARIEVFDNAGVYLRTISSLGEGDGEITEPSGMVLDAQGNLQVSDRFLNKIQIFNKDTGAYIGKYGTSGSGIEEFFDLDGLALNPLSNSITAVDSGNHRVALIPAGTKINNLIPSADVFEISDRISLVSQYINPSATGANSLSSQMYFGDYIVSDFTVNMTQDRNWENVNVLTLPEESLTLVVNLNPTDAPGISTTHTLYAVKKTGQTGIRVCPDALLLEDITSTCTNGHTLKQGDAGLSIVTIDNTEYWKATGLTGTGIMSITSSPTPTATPTITVSATPTTTATATPTITTSPTPTVSPKPTAIISASITPLVTLPTVVKGATPVCPVFTSFTTSATIVTKEQSVLFSWETKNTEVVRTVLSQKDLDPIGSFSITPTQTAEFSFVADNGDCIAKKNVTIYVVDKLPWTNTITVGTGILLIEAAIALQQPTMFGNIWLAGAALINRRKKRSWGYVYDSITKAPLSRAVIRLMRKDDHSVIDTVVSEANGSFRLTPRLGTFLIIVSRANYTFPSKTVSGDSDGGYANVYTGGELAISDVGKGILLSIPIDPILLTESERKTIKMRNAFDNFLMTGSALFIVCGFAYSAFAALQYPHFYNYLILLGYAALIIVKLSLTLFIPKLQGRVTDETGNIVSGTEIGLFDNEFNTLLYRTFTSVEGKYSFVVPNTSYHIKLMDSQYLIVSNGNTINEVPIERLGNDHIRVINTDLRVRKKNR